MTTLFGEPKSRPSWPRPLLPGARTALDPSRSGEPDLGFFLSWSCPRPSTVCPRASTPAAPKRHFGPAVPRAGSCSVLVVSHHLGGLLRTRIAGLLRPATGLGVHRVSDVRGPPSHRAEARCTVEPSFAFPATRFGPFEGFPSPTAAPHHCGRCPLVVAALPRWRHLRRSSLPLIAVSAAASGDRLQGFAPLTSPFRLEAVSSLVPLVPPMGSVPLQGPPSSAPAGQPPVHPALGSEPSSAVSRPWSGGEPPLFEPRSSLRRFSRVVV